MIRSVRLRSLGRTCTALAAAGLMTGCAALSSVAALRQVAFDLDGVTRVELAGVDLTRVRGYEDLSPLDAFRIGTALARGALPLEMVLDVRADNPGGNPEARLLALEWDLFLEGRRTVSGELSQALALPSGVSTQIPLLVRLELLEFFDGSARDLVNLAAGLAGVGGEPVAVRLDATPTVDTPIGPIRYPRPISMGSTVGSSGNLPRAP
ncbi:MAG: hypothetical protein EA350_12060 [Gemmatimonadales bacterium]|nr:MAG: hypothetical protein EA350_12060 [Gemmatimonadales bacterium]